MKTHSAVLLLLLWAGLVVVAAEHKDLQETSADTVSTQHTCQSDIHNVLREMTALITEQRMELRYTKTQMEALETRLRASENKAETMETRLRASEKTVEEQRVELRQTEARLTDSESLAQSLDKENEALKLSLNDLRKKQEEQEAAVRAVGGSVNITGSQVEELRREREERRVSFSASLVESGSETRGPFPTATTLVYRHVYTNIGNAYNPNTGIFTAPLRGVYHFYFVLHGHGSASIANAISLRKNSEHVVYAWAHQASYSVNNSNGVSLQLEKGDVVYLQLRQDARVFDDENGHTTFSGHLLFKV